MQSAPMAQSEALLPPPAVSRDALENSTLIAVVAELVTHARKREFALADELLTDVLAKLNGWPVEELNRLP
ncbi:hypothetical protein J8J14_20810 [Roseomonas sp. SSH11]|uniref:Uncharacterized protein n=1 Tax=Pararoseomonas baculiformis TaxID=2820812 RepID=A0ABS4ALX0_9PROT|nr:hypothetical protein [Pararoseomonas baculiformis]MBP0447219.1 hypothetical protein [Pararoseomonas baculiformis]